MGSPDSRARRGTQARPFRVRKAASRRGGRMPTPAEVFTTDVPARLDRLPWSRFHWLVVAALGITWILDGLEVTLVGSLSPAIAAKGALDLTAREVGLTGSAYILGAV